MRSDNNKDKRITSEKPVSIPLEFEDALVALLNTPPLHDKDSKGTERKKERSSEDK